MGGLGNQLFQWACARNLQEKYGHYIKYDLGFYNNQNWRKPQLNEFKNLQFNTIEIQPAFHDIGIGDSFCYDNFSNHNLSDLSVRYHLHGYWQSEKYFKENENIIRNDLEINDSMLYHITDKYPFLGKEKVTSIHIRRTDYVTSNGYHPVQTITYYEEALSIINNDKIVVFSDDINWCKENLNFNNMVFAENNTNIEDMYLMSMCNDNIIANSSFGWWAAWLNKNAEKKIIAPLDWFGPGAPSDKDIVPDSWIRL